MCISDHGRFSISIVPEKKEGDQDKDVYAKKAIEKRENFCYLCFTSSDRNKVHVIYIHDF